MGGMTPPEPLGYGELMFFAVLFGLLVGLIGGSAVGTFLMCVKFIRGI